MDEKQFWDDQKSSLAKPDQEKKAVIEEMATVPQTHRGPLRWANLDENIFGEVPAPLSVKDSQSRVDHINERCKEIFTQYRRADFWLFKNLNGFRLLEFDRLDDTSKKAVLDQRHADTSDMSYRKHRSDLHQVQLQAQQTLHLHRLQLHGYMKLPSVCELADDERIEFDLMYKWLLYQLNFDSIKWLQLPRSYNRPKMLTELMIQLFIDTYASCTFLKGEQIQSWFSRNTNAWRLLLDKNVIFIAISKPMSSAFWDLLYEEVQKLVTSKKSVVFVNHQGPGQHFPAELKAEYRALATIQNNSQVKMWKFDRTTFDMLYIANERQVGE